METSNVRPSADLARVQRDRSKAPALPAAAAPPARGIKVPPIINPNILSRTENRAQYKEYIDSHLQALRDSLVIVRESARAEPDNRRFKIRELEIQAKICDLIAAKSITTDQQLLELYGNSLKNYRDLLTISREHLRFLESSFRAIMRQKDAQPLDIRDLQIEIKDINEKMDKFEAAVIKTQIKICEVKIRSLEATLRGQTKLFDKAKTTDELLGLLDEKLHLLFELKDHYFMTGSGKADRVNSQQLETMARIFEAKANLEREILSSKQEKVDYVLAANFFEAKVRTTFSPPLSDAELAVLQEKKQRYVAEIREVVSQLLTNYEKAHNKCREAFENQENPALKDALAQKGQEIIALHEKTVQDLARFEAAANED